jgi:phage tail-like protein
MPPGPKARPYKSTHFTVEIDGVPSGAFSEIQLPELTTPPVEYREGTDAQLEAHRIPGRPQYGPARLRRGFRGTLDLYTWWRQAAEGDPNGKRGVQILLLNVKKDVLFRWLLRDAWPMKYSMPLLNANGNEIAIEEVELAYEGVELQEP